MKNRSERQRLEVIHLALDRQLARNLRRIELDRIEFADWSSKKVMFRPTTASTAWEITRNHQITTVQGRDTMNNPGEKYIKSKCTYK